MEQCASHPSGKGWYLCCTFPSNGDIAGTVPAGSVGGGCDSPSPEETRGKGNGGPRSLGSTYTKTGPKQRFSRPLSKEGSTTEPLCRAKPSPSFINLQASSPPATFLSVQAAQLPTGADPTPTECLGLLERMYANIQLQTQLAQRQMAILENLQASRTQPAPGRGSKNSSLPALSRSLLPNRLPQFRK
ncbi:TSSK6-activating co-chaperone protein isoform X1 [Suricata suricatta]|uniref:TSSK6 activating cochaperone n=1 Tax=Suricata suricatta TaxID=37032 RepID=A0A673SME9_SURSU|nr:TSSK6-activating co-chaperone protein isoform X1 [Suricata suricatta]XP_029791836.1 TSSK6-activating co-chaperone protein isoform X1 [Suricata suricatta]